MSRVIKEVGLPIAKRYLLKTDSTTRKVMKAGSRINGLEYLASGGLSLRALNGAYQNTRITAVPRNAPLSSKIVM